ncbi:SpoIIE family protein phosphatase [Actinacidiphila rubida]|uniref:PAS fold-containing protein n=1 Tax=Actinacidiphila rubida TaxID=310780 RepID=A0A1H8UPU0_9ACTN|nr:SpoIIE family protein phosphatase [Actinacidiphila rubida]SEP05023.1 PAS fold-containing protein [Actinacidiphila rubida]
MDASDELLQVNGPSALLTLDGVVRRLNAAMARTLGRPAEQCVGRGFGDLFPAEQLTAIDSLVTHAATTKSVAMRVLEFPGPGAASVVCLVQARSVDDPVGGGRLVWVRSLDAGNDRGGLLIPFRLAAKAANLGLCRYSHQAHELEWLGDAPALAALFQEASMSLYEVVRRVHPDDRRALRRLMRSTATTAHSPWTRLRFLTERDSWHTLACRARRFILGYGGPERVYGAIRDDTQAEVRRRRALVALSAERQRADGIAAFSSALMSAATEQEVQQVVLTRLASTFGGTGAALALINNGHLRVSSDAGIPLPVAALHGMPLDAISALPHVIRTGKPQFIASQEDYLRRWPHGAMVPYLDQLESGFAISIASLSPIGDQPLGAWLVTYNGEHHSSPDEQALMDTLADLAGQALKRVRLHEARVELATALQQNMLPTLPEHLPGLEVAARYRPSRDGLDIGGDWYDAFVTPDGAIVLEIGDAQGHDVDAAAAMGQVRASMRAIAAQESDPATVLARTNDLLVTMNAPRFASCTMLHIDPGDGRVTGASAGHVPLLYARDDGSHNVRELPGGPVLGVLPDADYSEGTFTLDRNAALIMVTDGVVEGPAVTLEAGLERAGKLAARAVHDGLNAEETADRVLDAAVAVNHLDDVAVLIIQRT